MWCSFNRWETCVHTEQGVLVTNPDLSKIKAKISTTKGTGYTPGRTVTGPSTQYFYMFTGGYEWDSAGNKLGGPTSSEDDGPAGEVELTTNRPGFSIEIDDSTGTGFQITCWNLASDAFLQSVSFQPTPNVPLNKPTSKLSITATGLAHADHGNYDGYYVTITNSNNETVELDPRIYDMS